MRQRPRRGFRLGTRPRRCRIGRMKCTYMNMQRGPHRLLRVRQHHPFDHRMPSHSHRSQRLGAPGPTGRQPRGRAPPTSPYSRLDRLLGRRPHTPQAVMQSVLSLRLSIGQLFSVNGNPLPQEATDRPPAAPPIGRSKPDHRSNLLARRSVSPHRLRRQRHSLPSSFLRGYSLGGTYGCQATSILR